jgi:hypothetical protein
MRSPGKYDCSSKLTVTDPASMSLTKDHKKAIVFCKNSRSRSPNVIFVFFILFRGMDPEKTKQWMTELYCRLRPKTARSSNQFPNFNKFCSVSHTEHFSCLVCTLALLTHTSVIMSYRSTSQFARPRTRNSGSTFQKCASRYHRSVHHCGA